MSSTRRQREGLEILRRIDQYIGNEESSPLIVDLQARVAVSLDGWAKGMVSEGSSVSPRWPTTCAAQSTSWAFPR